MKRCRVYCNSENRSMYEFNRKITMSVLKIIKPGKGSLLEKLM